MTGMSRLDPVANFNLAVNVTPNPTPCADDAVTDRSTSKSTVSREGRGMRSGWSLGKEGRRLGSVVAGCCSPPRYPWPAGRAPRQLQLCRLLTYPQSVLSVATLPPS